MVSQKAINRLLQKYEFKIQYGFINFYKNQL